MLFKFNLLLNCWSNEHNKINTKELSLCNKIKCLNPNISWTRSWKPLIFQTQIIWFKRIHSLKYLRSTTFGSKDIVIRNSEFVAKTQFLCMLMSFRKSLTQFYINYLRQEHQIDVLYVSFNTWDSQVSSYTPFHFSFTVPFSEF